MALQLNMNIARMTVTSETAIALMATFNVQMGDA